MPLGTPGSLGNENERKARNALPSSRIAPVRAAERHWPFLRKLIRSEASPCLRESDHPKRATTPYEMSKCAAIQR